MSGINTKLPWNHGRHTPCIAPETLRCARGGSTGSQGRADAVNPIESLASGGGWGARQPQRPAGIPARARANPLDLRGSLGATTADKSFGPLVSNGPAGANRPTGSPPSAANWRPSLKPKRLFWTSIFVHFWSLFAIMAK